MTTTKIEIQKVQAVDCKDEVFQSLGITDLKSDNEFLNAEHYEAIEIVVETNHLFKIAYGWTAQEALSNLEKESKL